MAGKRHNSNSKPVARNVQREQRHLENVRYLTRSGKRPDPSNVRAVARAARELRQREALERYYSHKVTKRQAEQLRERGFHVSKRGVAVDAPRDAQRKKIKGARVRVTKDATVVWSVGQRRDYIVGLTKKEKKAFAENPELVTKQILARLRKKNKTLARFKPSKIQKRLQWGAFQATKDFSYSYFNKNYFATPSPEDRRAKKKTPRLDKLTGLHFVVHLPTPKRKGKRAKKGKRR